MKSALTALLAICLCWAVGCGDTPPAPNDPVSPKAPAPSSQIAPKLATFEVVAGAMPKMDAPIAVWAGADKLGELKQGKLTVKFSKPGFYPVYLKAVDDTGAVTRSRPNTLIVE